MHNDLPRKLKITIYILCSAPFSVSTTILDWVMTKVLLDHHLCCFLSVHDSDILTITWNPRWLKKRFIKWKMVRNSEDSIVILTPVPLSTKPCHSSFAMEILSFLAFKIKFHIIRFCLRSLTYAQPSEMSNYVQKRAWRLLLDKTCFWFCLGGRGLMGQYNEIAVFIRHHTCMVV